MTLGHPVPIPVDVHVSRNRTCRREAAATWGQGAGHPKRLLPGCYCLAHHLCPLLLGPQPSACRYQVRCAFWARVSLSFVLQAVFKNGREGPRNMLWMHRSDQPASQTASRLTARNKTQAIAQGRGTMAIALATSATAAREERREERCELCSRRFISKHALRIHLTRNVNCRRQVSSYAPSHSSIRTHLLGLTHLWEHVYQDTY